MRVLDSGEPFLDARKAGRSRRKRLDIEDADLLSLLERHDFNLSSAARELGVCRNTLYRRVSDSNLVKPAYKLGRDEIERALNDAGGDLKKAARLLMVSSRALGRRLRKLKTRSS